MTISKGGIPMNTAEPIRNIEELERFKAYYREKVPDARNYLLIILGLNTALRISDELSLKWKDVYHFESDSCKQHLQIVEQKTGKTAYIYLNEQITAALKAYMTVKQTTKEIIHPEDYIFVGKQGGSEPISRVQAFRIIKKAAKYSGTDGIISCHSLRKTFGYHAWKQGFSPVLLMNIYNHSSFTITKRYLGIEQDDRDLVYRTIQL